MVAWCSLLILNESASCDMRVLESNAILWLTSWVECRRKHNHHFFWLWTVLLNATHDSHQHSWLKRSSNQRHERYCDDQMWDSNSWWSNHMLDDILFSTQFLVTHLVATYCVGDNRDILGMYLACGSKQQTMFIMFLGTTCKYRTYLQIIEIALWPSRWLWPTENIVTKNWVQNKMSSSIWWSPQLFETLIWSSQ